MFKLSTPGSATKLAVIGAGPIGLEAAIRGLKRGWDVTVYERDTIGAHLMKWGHVRFFTPVKDNVSKILWDALPAKPDPNSFLTGRDFVTHVLKPLSQVDGLKGKVKEGTKVLSVSKRRMIKQELPNHPLRQDRAFQILVQTQDGQEHVEEANFVLDASGVFGNPNWSGESGLPCPGEKGLNSHVARHLPDIVGEDKEDWIGKTILLIGDGHSAATAMMWFGQLHKENAKTRVHWVVPSDRSRPVVEVAEDPLPERQSTVQESNNLGQKPPEGWNIYRKQSLLSVKPLKTGGVEATVGRNNNKTTLQVDKILSLTGYRSDTSIADELQIQISPVTGGAAGLAKSLMSIKDCLSPIEVPPENLDSGEKGFYMIGHKSYGRLNTFLLRSGLQQLDLIFSRLN